jgi:serine/threonine protein kinase
MSLLTPTPSGVSTIYGQWAVHITIAQGAGGKVFSATNSRGELVAVKRLSAKVSTTRTIKRERRSLERLTALSKEHSFSGIIRLIEVIDVGGAMSPDKDYIFVPSPLCQTTLDQYIQSEKRQLGGTFSIRPWRFSIQFYKACTFFTAIAGCMAISSQRISD